MKKLLRRALRSIGIKHVRWPKKLKLKRLHMNKIVRILIIMDLITILGFGLMGPIFAVFITEQIKDGSILVIGFSEMIYLGVSALLQIPIGYMIDHTDGEHIDFYLTIIGTLIQGLAIFLYLFATTSLHIYIIEALFGLGAACVYPAWMGLFTRNIDEDKESFEWSVHSSLTDFTRAVSAVIGAVVAQYIGFRPLFAIVATLSVLGAVVLFLFYRSSFRTQA